MPSDTLLPLPKMSFSCLLGESSLFLQYEEEKLVDGLFSGLLGRTVCSEPVFPGGGELHFPPTFRRQPVTLVQQGEVRQGQDSVC